MKLDPNIARNVSETIGRPIPKPGSEAFDALLLELKRDDPALAETLQSAMIHTDLGDMETQAKRRSIGENRLRGLRRALFQRYDDLDQTWHLSKLKMLAWGSLLPLGLLGSLFLGPSLLGSAEQPGLQAAPIPEVEPTVTVAAPQDDDPFQESPTVVTRSGRALGAISGSQAVPDVVAQEKPAADQPFTVDDFGIADTETAAAAQPQAADEAETTAASSMLGSDPQLPLTSAAEDPGLGVYRAGASESGVDPGLMVYRVSGNAAAGTGSPLQGAADPFAQPDSASGDGPVGLAAYRRAALQEDTPAGLRAFAQRPTQEAELRAAISSQPNQVAGTRHVLPVSTGEAPTYLTSGPAMSSENSGAAAPNEAAPYRVGDSLDATLQTGVVVLGDAPLPVLARADDGSVWQGQATLTPTGRVDVHFSRVLAAGRQHRVTAVAQSGDGYLGLLAQVSETTPALASDLARGALRGLASYASALGEATEVRFEGGTPVISQSAPPLGASVAGSVAQLFSPPEGDAQQALVRLAQVPVDTPLKVVVLGQDDVLFLEPR